MSGDMELWVITLAVFDFGCRGTRWKSENRTNGIPSIENRNSERKGEVVSWSCGNAALIAEAPPRRDPTWKKRAQENAGSLRSG
jgi:hypothetical protein